MQATPGSDRDYASSARAALIKAFFNLAKFEKSVDSAKVGGSYFLEPLPAVLRRLCALRSLTKPSLSEALLSRSVSSSSDPIFDTATRLRRGRLLLKLGGEAMTYSQFSSLRSIKGLDFSELNFFSPDGSLSGFGLLSPSLV